MSNIKKIRENLSGMHTKHRLCVGADYKKTKYFAKIYVHWVPSFIVLFMSVCIWYLEQSLKNSIRDAQTPKPWGNINKHLDIKCEIIQFTISRNLDMIILISQGRAH